jgi:NAD(P)-dependent dehydrogenase (short-subunit alcohol dehydrogenase family)
MAGRVCVITGANSGIGKATALELAKMGVKVVMVCRDRKKGERAREEIAAESSNDDVELFLGDLSLMREVRRLAAELASAHEEVHVLVNNAGSTFPSHAETDDGFERTMALNYFSPFLLTNLLLGRLRAGAPSRVVNVASAAHYGARLDLGKINGEGDQGMLDLAAYGRSKLALVLFTYELARRIGGTGVTCNCVHPGPVRTNIWTHAGALTPLTRLASLFMRSPEKGAETVVYLASSPEVEGVTGKYFYDLKERRSSHESRDERLASELWDLSLKLTGLAAMATSSTGRQG